MPDPLDARVDLEMPGDLRGRLPAAGDGAELREERALRGIVVDRAHVAVGEHAERDVRARRDAGGDRLRGGRRAGLVNRRVAELVVGHRLVRHVEARGRTRGDVGDEADVVELRAGDDRNLRGGDEPAVRGRPGRLREARDVELPLIGEELRVVRDADALGAGDRDGERGRVEDARLDHDDLAHRAAAVEPVRPRPLAREIGRAVAAARLGVGPRPVEPAGVAARARVVRGRRVPGGRAFLRGVARVVAPVRGRRAKVAARDRDERDARRGREREEKVAPSARARRVHHSRNRSSF